MPALIEIPASAAGSWKPGVQESADLPASGNALYDVRASADDSVLFMWNGTTWLSTAGGGGSFNNPAITGTLNFNSSLMTIVDAGDRVRFNSPVYEFNCQGDNVLYLAGGSGAHQQVSVISGDLWLEQNGSGGGIAFLSHNTTDLGWSSIQQGELPGAHGPRDIFMGRNLRWTATTGGYTANYGLWFSGGRMTTKFDQFDISSTGGGSYTEFRHGSRTIATNNSLRFDEASYGLQYLDGFADMFGKATLVSGTKDVTIASCTTSTIVVATRLSKGSSTAIGSIECKPLAGKITINALKADATLETNDVSVVSYMLIQPI